MQLSDRTIDTARRLVLFPDGRTVRLTTKEAELLAYLAERPGQDVSRDALLIEVWEYRAAFATRAVDIAMRRLRKKVEPDPSSPTHLISVHGVGYRFVPPTERPARGSNATETPEPTPARITTLPHEPAAFVGRATAVSTLTKRLSDTPGVVLLVGPGGVGKTRLALRIAHLLSAHFTSVQWVDCSCATDRDGLNQAVAAALGVPLPKSDDPEAGIEHLGLVLSSRSHSLIVLDNVEQVAADAAQALGVWLTHAPQVRWLVTSRCRLGLPQEHVEELEPLPVASARELFMLRARAAGASRLDDDDDALTRIVERLDGLPLAIELAAPRARLLSPAQLADRLQQSFSLLRARPGSERRHATLRATMDWSWGLLTGPQQRALAWASVFAGGFTFDAAEAVLDTGDPSEPWVIDLLEQLCDHSLIYIEGDEEPTSAHRFQMLGSIREYARERLEQRGELAAAHASHAGWFLKCAARWQEQLRGRGDVEAFHNLAAETENLLAICTHGEPEEVRQAVLSLRPVLTRRGPYGRLAELTELALSLPGAAPLTEAALRLLRYNVRCLLGRLDAAEADAHAALELARGSGDRAEVQALSGLAYIHKIRADSHESVLLHSQAAELARVEGHSDLCAHALIALAHAHQLAGRVAEAEATMLEARTLLQELGAAFLLAKADTHLGRLLLDCGRHHEAARHLEAARSAWESMDNRVRLCDSLLSLGALANMQGNKGRAEQLYRQAITLCSELGYAQLQIKLQTNLAAALLAQGGLDEAITLLGASADEARRHGFSTDLASAEGCMAVALAQSDAVSAAEGALARATSALEGLSEPSIRGMLTVIPGFILLAQARLADDPGERGALRAHAEGIARDAVGDAYPAVSSLGSLLQETLKR